MNDTQQLAHHTLHRVNASVALASVGQERVRGAVLQQRRLPPAPGRAAVALLLVQSLPLLKKTFREPLRHEEMAPQHNAFRVMQQATDAASASEASQLLHKHLAQCSSGKQSAALLETNVGTVHVPLLRVSSR
jgi:hypothetical protein